MTDVPAFVNNARLDVLAANPLARALYAPLFADPTRPPNHARFAFLNPHAHEFWIDWNRIADDTVAVLRTAAGRDPYDKALTDLVGELGTRSDAFRVRWASHDVRLHRTGLKHFHHPVVGDLHLNFESMELAADPGLTLTALSAKPGQPTTTHCGSWPAGRPPTTQQTRSLRRTSPDRTNRTRASAVHTALLAGAGLAATPRRILDEVLQVGVIAPTWSISVPCIRRLAGQAVSRGRRTGRGGR